MEQSSQSLRQAVIRFDAAIAKLEESLDNAISSAKSMPAQSNEAADLIIREELALSKSREKQLEDAVKQARGALTDAIDDIRGVLGQV